MGISLILYGLFSWFCIKTPAILCLYMQIADITKETSNACLFCYIRDWPGLYLFLLPATLDIWLLRLAIASFFAASATLGSFFSKFFIG